MFHQFFRSLSLFLWLCFYNVKSITFYRAKKHWNDLVAKKKLKKNFAAHNKKVLLVENIIKCSVMTHLFVPFVWMTETAVNT